MCNVESVAPTVDASTERYELSALGFTAFVDAATRAI
jgi:hypothetical protein